MESISSTLPSPEMTRKIVSLSRLGEGCDQPSKPPADSEQAAAPGGVRQEPAFPVCGTESDLRVPRIPLRGAVTVTTRNRFSVLEQS